MQRIKSRHQLEVGKSYCYKDCNWYVFLEEYNDNLSIFVDYKLLEKYSDANDIPSYCYIYLTNEEIKSLAY